MTLRQKLLDILYRPVPGLGILDWEFPNLSFLDKDLMKSDSPTDSEMQ